jgi:hypothetical protein
MPDLAPDLSIMPDWAPLSKTTPAKTTPAKTTPATHAHKMQENIMQENNVHENEDAETLQRAAASLTRLRLLGTTTCASHFDDQGSDFANFADNNSDNNSDYNSDNNSDNNSDGDSNDFESETESRKKEEKKRSIAQLTHQAIVNCSDSGIFSFTARDVADEVAELLQGFHWADNMREATSPNLGTQHGTKHGTKHGPQHDTQHGTQHGIQHGTLPDFFPSSLPPSFLPLSLLPPGSSAPRSSAPLSSAPIGLLRFVQSHVETHLKVLAHQGRIEITKRQKEGHSGSQDICTFRLVQTTASTV